MLKVKDLCKNYPGFKLKNISFELDSGFITGFIGSNGAGKTTTLKSILGMIGIDGGQIELFGENAGDKEKQRQSIGFMLGETSYYPNTRVSRLVKVYSAFFDNWSDVEFNDLLLKFGIDKRKKVKELSTGMKVKLGIAMALSYGAKLLIFDEPTSGLDPIARNELLQIFRELVADGERSILFSTHITSDLDKCADYILFIKNGEIVADSAKDDIIDGHYLVAGGKAQLTDEIKNKLIGYEENLFGFTGLMKSEVYDEADNLDKGKPNLEDIMLYYNKNGDDNYEKL